MNKIILIIGLVFIGEILFAKKPVLKNIGPQNIVVNDFCISADGKCVYAAFENKVEIYDVTSNKLIDSIIYTTGECIIKICISENGNTLLAASKAGNVYYTNAATKKSVVLAIPTYKISAIDMHQILNRIAIATYDGTIIITDTLGIINNKNQPHNDIVTKVTFSSDGLYLASSGMDGKIIIYNMYNKNTTTLIKQIEPFRDVDFSSESNKIIAASDNGKTYEWKINSYENTLIKETRIQAWVTSVQYNSDSKAQASCNSTGNVKICTHLGDSYNAKLNCILTKIAFIPNKKILSVILLGHKQTLKLLSATDMKHKT